MTYKNKLRKSYFFFLSLLCEKEFSSKKSTSLISSRDKLWFDFKQMYTAKSDRKWTFI